MADILQFKPRPGRVRYAPGVTPFDPLNPVHVRAWNTLFEIGWKEGNRDPR